MMEVVVEEMNLGLLWGVGECSGSAGYYRRLCHQR